MHAAVAQMWAALRSRRLAVGLISAVVAYSVLGTVVPQGDADSVTVSQWSARYPSLVGVVDALGLHHAFATPFFLLLAAALTIATTACAIERTQRAVRYSRRGRELTAGESRRLAERPGSVIAVDDRYAGDPVAAVAERLRAKRYDVRTGPRVIEATKGLWGTWGSPLFHWALVALFAVVALGQATRSEGAMGLYVGEPLRDAPANYLRLDTGPLFANRFTGLDLLVEDVVLNYKADGVDRGSVPHISALRNGSVVKSQRVYANSPLRVGSTLVHMTDTGLSPVFSVEATSGEALSRLPFQLSYPADEASTTVPGEFSLVGEGGQGVIDVRIRMPLARDTSGAMLKLVPPAPVSLVETAPSGTERYGRPVALELGRSIQLPDGRYLRFVSADDWVLVTVANDWSVPWIYFLLGVMGIGLSISILVPSRRVLVGMVEDECGTRAHVVTQHSRRDPAFGQRVHELVAHGLHAPVVPGAEDDRAVHHAE